MTFHLVHGFNVRDPARTVGKLLPYLFGLGRVFDYGWQGLFGVRLYTRQTARQLASQIKPNDVAIGHSNGANIINRACWDYNAPLPLAVYINPALDSNMPLAPQVKQCRVYWSADDWLVKLARLLPAHDWGAMGATGATNGDPRYCNIAVGGGHSDCFKSARLMAFIVAQTFHSYARIIH